MPIISDAHWGSSSSSSSSTWNNWQQWGWNWGGVAGAPPANPPPAAAKEGYGYTTAFGDSAAPAPPSTIDYNHGAPGEATSNSVCFH